MHTVEEYIGRKNATAKPSGLPLSCQICTTFVQLTRQLTAKCRDSSLLYAIWGADRVISPGFLLCTPPATAVPVSQIWIHFPAQLKPGRVVICVGLTPVNMYVVPDSPMSISQGFSLVGRGIFPRGFMTLSKFLAKCNVSCSDTSH
jgi:hypothetical protein